MFTLGTITMAQNISGYVVDNEKTPIMAANVYFISCPQNGTVSNIDGRFSIPFTNERDTLFVSFIGTIPDVLKRISTFLKGNLFLTLFIVFWAYHSCKDTKYPYHLHL